MSKFTIQNFGFGKEFLGFLGFKVHVEKLITFIIVKTVDTVTLTMFFRAVTPTMFIKNL
jgi:hypothetical protein